MIGKRITERGGISVDENQIHHAIEQAYQLIVEAHRNMTDIWRTHVLFYATMVVGSRFIDMPLTILDRISG